MRIFSFIIGFVALLALCSCNKATFIKPDKAQVDFTLEGGEEKVHVSSDGSWEVKECPEWVTTGLQDSTIVIRVPVNDSGNVREGNVVLASGELTANIAVKQTAKCTHITPASDTVEFEKDGGSKTVNIDTDGALQVTAPEGFTAEYAGGVLTVTAGANEGGKRSGEITLTADEQTATINVSQAGSICPKCNGTGKVRCTKCRGEGVSINDSGFAYTVIGCSGCGGYGNFTDADPNFTRAINSQHAGYRKGTGKMNCPTCGGAGH